MPTRMTDQEVKAFLNVKAAMCPVVSTFVLPIGQDPDSCAMARSETAETRRRVLWQNSL